MSDDALLSLLAALRDHGYAFVPPTPATHAIVMARPGYDRARHLRDVFGWSRAFDPAILPGAVREALMASGFAEPVGDLWRSRLRVASLDGTLFLHSAYPTAGADAVFFGPDTYRFATCIGAHLRERRGAARRVVDVGCGAGPGAILVARTIPDAEVIGVDINPAALRLARINATFGDAARVAMRDSDLLSGVDGAFDLIVANPPYLVDPAARAYRHGGGDLGSGVSLAILDAAIERLASGGSLVLYTGAAIVEGRDPFREAAEARCHGTAIQVTYRELDPDVFGEELAGGAYAGADRIAAVCLIASKEG